MAYWAVLFSLVVLLVSVFAFGNNSAEANVVAKLILMMFGTAMAFTLLSRKFWAMP